MMDHGSEEMAECQMSMLWNWNTIDSCFIASSWQVKDNGMMAASCIGVGLLVVILEVLRLMIKKYDILIAQSMRRHAAVLSKSHSLASEKYTSLPTNMVLRASPLQQILRAVLHAVTFGVAYFVMLLAMSFSGYIIVSIIIGAGLGKFVTDWPTLTIGEHAEAKGTTIENQDTTICCQ
ncbi:ctr copper transporter [Fusarium sporotrichioides]|uniref:Copper transport protein n=1 Tax=Fusarium sporotrichioides TaxID=5514 RepID=A0A395RVB4_FUSSP|nr:ctr copper transporter [Fusarium sporotrichioides]